MASGNALPAAPVRAVKSWLRLSTSPRVGHRLIVSMLLLLVPYRASHPHAAAIGEASWNWPISRATWKVMRLRGSES